MYMHAGHALGQPQPAGNCAALVKNAPLFSQAVAQHYVRTELKRQPAAGLVRCRPDGKLCEVHFPGELTVGVSLVKMPAYVIARQIYSRDGTPRRTYDHSCSAAGEVLLARRPDMVGIYLVDLSGVFKHKSKLRTQFQTRLAEKFNHLDPGWLKQNFFKFRVIYLDREPSDEHKASFRRLDFPVYLLDRQHTYETVKKLMEAHHIPQFIGKTDLYKLAQTGWNDSATRGVGIPSGRGDRKAAFIKTYRVLEDGRSDLVQAFTNVIAHEIGHTGNLIKHSKTGLMKYPLPLGQDIDFSSDDKLHFLANLVRLRAMHN
jgi:hypothetical protein